MATRPTRTKTPKLLIVNCNGTIRESISNPGGYINLPQDQQIIVGAENTLLSLDDTWTVVGVHNAGSVDTYNKLTKQMFQTLEEAIAEQRYTLKLIRAYRAISAIYICPNHLGVGTSAIKVTATRTIRHTEHNGYRLPLTGMLELAIAAYGNNKTEEFLYVGDEDTDAEAAESLAIPFKSAKNWWS